MSDISLTTGYLISVVSRRMSLTWVAGKAGATRPLSKPSGADLNVAGPLNFIHPNRVQLIGRTELAYLDSLADEVRQDSIASLFDAQPLAVVFTEGTPPPEDLITAADASATPLLLTDSQAPKALETLQYYLHQFLAERTSCHGVLMEVLGMGVLLTGEAGVGKSEVALELVTRGHRLVADDAPELARIAPDTINGICPPMLQDFLEVRGLGLLNIRALFGESAIKRNKFLRLVIDLKRHGHHDFGELDRLTGSYSSLDVLGLEIPKVTIPVAPGRNIAVLTETAVRNHMLRLKGYDASEDFIERQRRKIPLASDDH